MSVGYKFKNGKFVPRTEEEERRYVEYFTTAVEDEKSQRMPKRKDAFVQVTLKQLDRLMQTKRVDFVGIFFILCYENFRHRGEAFILPSDKLTEFGGFSLWTQRRALTFLVKVGLILVQRVHKKPPLVRVLDVA